MLNKNNIFNNKNKLLYMVLFPTIKNTPFFNCLDISIELTDNNCLRNFDYHKHMNEAQWSDLSGFSESLTDEMIPFIAAFDHLAGEARDFDNVLKNEENPINPQECDFDNGLKKEETPANLQECDCDNTLKKEEKSVNPQERDFDNGLKNEETSANLQEKEEMRINHQVAEPRVSRKEPQDTSRVEAFDHLTGEMRNFDNSLKNEKKPINPQEKEKTRINPKEEMRINHQAAEPGVLPKETVSCSCPQHIVIENRTPIIQKIAICSQGETLSPIFIEQAFEHLIMSQAVALQTCMDMLNIFNLTEE